jgi:lysyl-tRNA synthetase class I
MQSFKSSLERFYSALKELKLEDLEESKEASITDFSEKKKAYRTNTLNSSFNLLINSISEIDSLDGADDIKAGLEELKKYYKEKDLEKTKELAKSLIELESKLKYPKKEPSLTFKINNIPSEIESDMKADLDELEKCFHAESFRASVILCGRLLETSLHRKYFEKTNNDLLEKSPGIGLGNLVAKMKQENISLDPAVSQQIHLINQVRIYSVHKKKQAFYPSKEQTHAIILYTIDVIRKLFS